MPQPTQSASGENRPDKTLVRGADGALYFVSKDGVPERLTDEESEKVTQLIGDAEDELANRINAAVPRIAPNCTRNARVVIPEVFMD